VTRLFWVLALVLAGCTLDLPTLSPTATQNQAPTAPIDTLTPVYTQTAENPANTPLWTFTPLLEDTPTWQTNTPDATITTWTITPTPTPETSLPITVHNEAELDACKIVHNATCEIVGTIYLTKQLTITVSGVTIRGGALTNVPEYPHRLVAITQADHVLLDGITVYGSPSLSGSAIKDMVLIYNSHEISLDHVTLLYSEDENLDIQYSTNVIVTNSVIMQPLHCAMHTKGCHGYAALIVNSTVSIRDSVIGSAKARMPELQNSHVTMERVLLDNLDGSAIQVQCDGVLVTQGMIIRGGFDTDDVSYGITTPHAEDCVPDGKAPPQITEKCTLVVNWHVSGSDKYPRVRRSSTYYTTPSTTEFKSDASGCTMPTGDSDDTTDDDMTRIIQNAGSQGTPACLLEANCQIIDAPPS